MVSSLAAAIRRPRVGQLRPPPETPCEPSTCTCFKNSFVCIASADALGEDVGTYIREVFDADDVLSQLRTVQSIVTHLETFPLARAQAACRRARFYGLHSYGGIKNILRKGLDLEPLPIVVQRQSGVLEAPRFAREIGELLQLPLEKTDAPN